MLLGSAYNRYMFKYTTQSINYVECHDNLTFYDKALYINDDIDLIRKQEKLATAMVILSQGVPFVHSGQEFFRTKNKVENSYKSGDDINKIDWQRREIYNEDIKFFKELINIRKKYSCFKLKSTSELEQNVEIIEMNSKSLMLHYNAKCNVLVIYKASIIEETIIIPDEYSLILSSTEYYEIEDRNQYILKDIGTYIFIKE